jgi:hypothetical protein
MKYFGDGSGRDSYIVSNFGGFVSPNTTSNPQATFYKNLRQNPRITNYNNEYFNKSYYSGVKWYSPKSRKLIKDAFYYQ